MSGRTAALGSFPPNLVWSIQCSRMSSRSICKARIAPVIDRACASRVWNEQVQAMLHREGGLLFSPLPSNKMDEGSLGTQLRLLLDH